MRARAAGATLVLTGAVLALAGHEGAPRSGSAALPGVRVVAAPPAPATATPGRTKRTSPTSGKKPAPATHRTVDGALVSTPYGNVQVALVLSGTKITGVRALHLTDANRHSVEISARAAPTLRAEVLAAQSARVDAVSGATYTSDGYLTSLQAAIDAAHL